MTRSIVVGVHGVGGIWGALATGVFVQAVAVAASVGFAFVGSPGPVKIADAIVGLRVVSRGRRYRGGPQGRRWLLKIAGRVYTNWRTLAGSWPRCSPASRNLSIPFEHDGNVPVIPRGSP
jgi:hypothetical protein